MKAKYEITMKLTVIHDIEKVDENLKSSDDLATDICHMICDEASMCGAVATYDIIESTIDIK